MARKTFHHFELALYLRQYGNAWASEESLCERLGISPPELSLSAENLRRLGYPVLGTDDSGYCLRGEAPFRAEEIAWNLGAAVVGSEVQVHDEVTSTNDVARQTGAQGHPPGLVVFAQLQTRGRGRFGRSWQSPKGKNLLFSVLFSPPEPVPATSLVTIASAVAVAEGIRKQTGLEARIRWPNDVMVNGKKVAGILVESARDSDRRNLWVLGVGINVTASPVGMASAGTLASELGAAVDRVLLARAVLMELDRGYERIEMGNHKDISERWRALSTILGERITLQRAGQRFSGRVVHISAREGVTLQLDDGLLATFPGEEVSLVT